MWLLVSLLGTAATTAVMCWQTDCFKEPATVGSVLAVLPTLIVGPGITALIVAKLEGILDD